MNDYSIDELESVFGITHIEEKNSGKRTLKLVKELNDGKLNGIALTLLGDQIEPITLDSFENKCPAFAQILSEQKNVGVSYSKYFVLTSFFAQVSHPGLAHEFACLNPKYAADYDTSEKGRSHTQAIIDKTVSFYEGGGKRGYTTYQGLDCTNACGHDYFDSRTSPIRHFLIGKLTAERFAEKNRVTGRRGFSSGLAAAEFNRFHDVVFSDRDGSFYQFNGTNWEKISDRSVRATVDTFIGKGCEPEFTNKTIEKLRATNLVGPDTFEPNRDYIAYKNGILKITPLFDRVMRCTNSEQINIAALDFLAFESMSVNERKSLNLVGTLGASFNRGAKISEFARYLETTFSGQVQLIELAQEIAGYCLIYQYPIHAFFILKGPGGNGKGIFLHILGALVGSQNVTHMNFANFNRFSTAALQHKLLNITDELPQNANWDLLKNLSGGGYTEAEEKHKPTYSFPSTSKFAFSTNEDPHFTDATQAFWARCIILGFNASFRASDKEITSYEEILLQEIDGIAQWALQGLIRLLKRGRFPSTPEVNFAATEARLASDTVRAFVSDRCVIDERLGEFTDNFYRAYKAFCNAHKTHPVSHKKFLTRLDDMGIKKERLPLKINDKKLDGPRKNFVKGIGYDAGLGCSDLEQARRHDDESKLWLSEKPQVCCLRFEFLINELRKDEGDKYSCASCNQLNCAMRKSDFIAEMDQEKRLVDHGDDIPF